jgi:RNA polymerase sigma-70 factor (ECF subfamily)
MSDGRTDRELVDGVLGGDREAFRALIERESQAVVAACRRIVRDAAEADDVAQDAFLQAYRALATFRGDGPFGAWLRRIAVRVAIAHLAGRHDLVRLNADGLDEQEAALQSRDDPEAQALDLEWRGAIHDAIARLPSSQRDVILLRFYGDLSLQEIAELTRDPLGTVKSRLHRGLAGLRDHLTPRSAQ